MTTIDDQHTGFVAHEYRTMVVRRDRELLYRDVYQSFGWSFEEHIPSGRLGHTVTLKMKRGRAIRNRTVVAELQRKAEESLLSIDRLERSTTTAASVVAYAVALLGCAYLAGSIFSLNAGAVATSVGLGVAGLVHWVLPRFLHTALRTRRTAKVTPLIDREYAVVYGAAEQAAGLLR